MMATVKGTVHAHSTNSYDGKMSYRELREFFLSRGFQFVAVTEHVERLEQRDIDRVVDDCRAHSDDQFVLVPGIEMDCFTVYFLGLERAAIDFASNRSVFDSLRAASALCVCAHPVRSHFLYPPWVLDVCDGVEVVNTKYDGHHYPRPESERLYRRLKARRPRAVALAGMDFHEPAHFSPIHLRLTASAPLSERFVLDSLASGAFSLYRGEEPLSEFSFLRRQAARARIGLMDLSHAVNRRIAASGLRVPRGLKRALRRMMER
jgi:hypothetical protein